MTWAFQQINCKEKSEREGDPQIRDLRGISTNCNVWILGPDSQKMWGMQRKRDRDTNRRERAEEGDNREI